MFQYELLIDDNRELESIESAVEILGASHINQEGWTTAYGGNGVRLYFTCHHSKRNINQILAVCNHAQITSCKKVKVA